MDEKTQNDIRLRYSVIGKNPQFLRALEKALQVASTDFSVLITGESGVGKEVFPRIIHDNSTRKHGRYIAVNCGGIPEGTMDSELFGHLKGSFTGALNDRKGYFEECEGGTLFLDEIGELPLATQAKLLRVLETGEFIRVGSSTVQKCNVRVIAATNMDMVSAVKEGKFREDLFYRINTFPIHIPPLRERKEDIYLLFRKFAADIANKYQMPSVRLTPSAEALLENYAWPGNVRQLKNIAEQISVLEENRLVEADILKNYLPQELGLTLFKGKSESIDFSTERDLLYKVLFDMRRDITDLKQLVNGLMDNNMESSEEPSLKMPMWPAPNEPKVTPRSASLPIDESETVVLEPLIETPSGSTLSLADKEKEMISSALKKYHGKRKPAAEELGISERTLYRKLKDYNLDK